MGISEGHSDYVNLRNACDALEKVLTHFITIFIKMFLITLYMNNFHYHISSASRR